MPTSRPTRLQQTTISHHLQAGGCGFLFRQRFSSRGPSISCPLSIYTIECAESLMPHSPGGSNYHINSGDCPIECHNRLSSVPSSICFEHDRANLVQRVRQPTAMPHPHLGLVFIHLFITVHLYLVLQILAACPVSWY
jgi:hypothetical protein